MQSTSREALRRMGQPEAISPEAFLARRRRRRVAAVAALVLGVGLYHVASGPAAGGDELGAGRSRVLAVHGGRVVVLARARPGCRLAAVRLRGIAVPRPRLARAALVRWTAGRRFALRRPAEEADRASGAVVGRVVGPAGIALAERLLLAGKARAGQSAPRRYELLEAQARHDGVGLWADGDRVSRSGRPSRKSRPGRLTLSRRGGRGRDRFRGSISAANANHDVKFLQRWGEHDSLASRATAR